MDDSEFSFFERRLMSEIEDIEQKIKTLSMEKEILLKQLHKARMEKEGLQFSVRKNSTNRILIENSVLMCLKDRGGKAKSDELLHQALFVIDSLNPNTFRTYLNRMKQKGLIASKNRGIWTLQS